MNANVCTECESLEVLDFRVMENRLPGRMNRGAFIELERSVQAALETYSNVHRGSGHNSLVTTHLYEQARDIVLEYVGLSKDNYAVIFCTPSRAKLLKARLKPRNYQVPVQRGHRPTAGCKGIGGRSQGAARRRSFPDRWRDGQTGLPRLGYLGQVAGQVRGRHARHR